MYILLGKFSRRALNRQEILRGASLDKPARQRQEAMKYLGVAQMEKGRVALPDAVTDAAEGQVYEVVEVGGDIWLLSPPLNRERLARLEKLTRQVITDHRHTLEGLAR
jgi:hypothetical protein